MRPRLPFSRFGGRSVQRRGSRPGRSKRDCNTRVGARRQQSRCTLDRILCRGEGRQPVVVAGCRCGLARSSLLRPVRCRWPTGRYRLPSTGRPRPSRNVGGDSSSRIVARCGRPAGLWLERRRSRRRRSSPPRAACCESARRRRPRHLPRQSTQTLTRATRTMASSSMRLGANHFACDVLHAPDGYQ